MIMIIMKGGRKTRKSASAQTRTLGRPVGPFDTNSRPLTTPPNAPKPYSAYYTCILRVFSLLSNTTITTRHSQQHESASNECAHLITCKKRDYALWEEER